jgi:hypothetical protein
VGELDRRENLVGVPINVRLRLERSGDGTYTESLDDVVWVTRDSDAWRVAKLSRVAAAASITLQSEGDLTTPPDVASEKRSFAAEVAEAKSRRQEREEGFRETAPAASCPDAKRYGDERNDVVDYRHPAPVSPTPQLPAADIQAVEVEASEGRICVAFEMAGDIRPETTFEFAIQSPDFSWGRAGFSQGFEVEVRRDGRARVSSGLDDERRSLTVPAEVGRAGHRLRLVLDRASFDAGRPFPGSRVPSRPLGQFQLRADVTFELSQERYLHDDLGPGPPVGVMTFPYP